jgi:hypothetical protein
MMISDFGNPLGAAAETLAGVPQHELAVAVE